MYERLWKMLKEPKNAIIVVLLLTIFSGLVGWYLGSHQGTLSIESLDTSGPIFSVASSTGDIYFVVAANGNVGVNTIYPATNLDVEGTLRARIAFPPPCTADTEGALTYDRLQKHFVGCTANGWRVLDN